jgi:hypothetical protein
VDASLVAAAHECYLDIHRLRSLLERNLGWRKLGVLVRFAWQREVGRDEVCGPALILPLAALLVLLML